MRAEAVSWDDWSATNAPPIAPEDKWHVALAPGEVKVVSLEQLDDLYRLSIVDAETKVWQDGMTEWQPLRVIAGLDEAPAPEPKRTHPKPPSPRSAPPPPRPKSVAPAPLAFATTQPAFIAPVVPIVPIQQMNSVRPLVVSQRPTPVARGGGGFGRFLIGLALIGGASVCLYRNGLVQQAATSLHREALFERLEGALGGPAFGTLRAVEQRSSSASSIPLTSSVSASRPAAEPTPAGTAVAAEPERAAMPGSAPPVVSLESIATEKVGTAHVSAVQAPVAAASPAPAPVKASVKSAPAVAAPAPKAEKAPAAPPPPQKSAAEMTERERLNAAIGQSMLASPPAPKKGAKAVKGSEYDPLNPKL